GGKDEISMVLKEAMGTALPVVATFHAGIPEVIDDGVNGLLVPERDDVALAAALERLVVDPPLRARIGAEGRRLVERVWEIGRQVEMLETIYHELAG
ncbi:MAG: glycosyltransferase, partial [Deltaproteobacteria bacterium]|nr:glycosyltransferase [Deltaproteobacteria bacterium]